MYRGCVRECRRECERCVDAVCERFVGGVCAVGPAEVFICMLFLLLYN